MRIKGSLISRFMMMDGGFNKNQFLIVESRNHKKKRGGAEKPNE